MEKQVHIEEETDLQSSHTYSIRSLLNQMRWKSLKTENETTAPIA